VAAPRVSDDPEVQRNYAAHLALTAALVAALRRLWPTIDLTNTAETLPRYRAGVTGLVDRFSLAASSLSLDHFDTMLAREGLSAENPPVHDVPSAKVQASIGWATDPLISGRDASLHEPVPADTVTIVQQRVEGAATKVVMDAGRNQLIEAIEADRRVRGWVRVARTDACAFCRMLATRPLLATRGGFYRTVGSAGRNANARFTGAGDFKFHNDCHCTIAPVLADHYEAPAHTRADAALWQEVTAGHSGQAAINAFRRAVDAQRRAA
jgi:hypothetical protein